MTWHLLIYRLPSQPSRARVAVWRELRRLGALPLQQAVVAVPGEGAFVAALADVRKRIERDGGTSDHFALTTLSIDEQAGLRERWNALRTQEYREIVEECETKFVREIEFELFRGNLTAGEAEEIEADLDKLKRWLGNVRARDLFGVPERALAEAAVADCERRLEDFVHRVFEAEAHEGPSTRPPIELPWGDLGGQEEHAHGA